ncbi:hypothetical protein [Paenibacillus sp. FSL R7-0337]
MCSHCGRISSGGHQRNHRRSA